MMPLPGVTVTDSDGGEAFEASDLAVQLFLPQQISLREPFATQVTIMQDGGKVIESRGQVIKMGSISGTTGFLFNAEVALQGNGNALMLPRLATDLDAQLGAVSGYLAFMKLRYLFRAYGAERRRGNIDAKLYFFDEKNDDYWRVEPDVFEMTRSSRKPMSYDYNIQFRCIEPSDNKSPPAQASAFVLGSAMYGTDLETNPLSDSSGFHPGLGLGKRAIPQNILTTIARYADMVTSGVNYLKFLDSVAQRAMQSTLNNLDNVVGFFENIVDTASQQLDLVPALLNQLGDSLAGLERVIGKYAAAVNVFTSRDAALEMNEWWLEVTALYDSLSVSMTQIVGSKVRTDIADTHQRYSTSRGAQGSTTDFLQEATGSTGSPDANPFLGTSGLSLITDLNRLLNAGQVSSTVVYNGEDIYAIARRLTGKIERFTDLILLNRLEFPFIVASANNKPPNTLAWGESILYQSTQQTTASVGDAPSDVAVPTVAGTVTTAATFSELIDNTQSWRANQWVGYTVTATTGGVSDSHVVASNTAVKLSLNGTWAIAITPGVTTYVVVLAQLNMNRPITADTRAYGTDLRAVNVGDGRVDLAWDATGDLATVSGIDNLIQAINLRARCQAGQHPFHPTYGLPSPVGRPYTAHVGILYVFFMRRSLLADPRINRVRNAQISVAGDVFTLTAEIQPVASRTALPISVNVGGS
jgi:hypothetical protein